MRNVCLFLFVTMLLLAASCVRQEKEKESGEMETLVIYTGRDTLLPGEESFRMVPVPDRRIKIPSDLGLQEKIRWLADSISACCFNDLPIEILALDTLPREGLVLTLNLAELPNYEGPGTMDPYQSWYDFFQGSSGGLNTTIVLRESFLQPDYKGSWIDAVEFYYQGKPIGEWDHLFLEGLLVLGK